jgi:hypothetical protein
MQLPGSGELFRVILLFFGKRWRYISLASSLEVRLKGTGFTMVRSGSESRLHRQLWAIALVALLSLVIIGGKPKPKPKPSANPNQKDDEAATPSAELPADLNLASMRLHAVDVIYELDLSTEQLAELRSASEGAASDRKRTAANANEKLTGAFGAFYKSLLTRADDQDIAKLRNQAAELVADDDNLHLDDSVEPTDTARSRANAFVGELTASQIAAYMASHADQVADPSEKMYALLIELHDNDSPDEADTEIKQTSTEVGMLMAGADAKASAAVADKVVAWVKTNRVLNDDQLADRHTDLLTSAKKTLGDVRPMDILSHWMDNEVATLLSNPQLPHAIEAVLSAQDH